MRVMGEATVRHHLAEIDKRRKIMETAVMSVTQGYQSALFLWGAPGLGKSHMLRQILDALVDREWKHHTAYSTPKGLMMTLCEAPNTIHVFEDCEKMLKTDLSASLLRAACGAPGDKERWVTYETAHETLRINVTGAIIIVTNANLARNNGPMQGVASRFRPIRWEMSLEERIATILEISKKPYTKGKTTLDPAECRKVAIELIGMVEEERMQTTLDIRLFCEHALPTYAYCKMTGDKNWADVLQAKVLGVAVTKEEGQSDRTARLQQLAVNISKGDGTAKEKVSKWKSLTELGQAIFYRHLREAKKKK